MKKIAFVGSKELGIKVLEEMYCLAPENLEVAITVNDSTDTRCALPLYQQFADRTGKTLRVLTKALELSASIAEFAPDLCIVAGWYWVLKPELLNMVPDGWLGIHASLLPRYRGGAPLVWAMINGETESGLTLFYFDEGMDTGDVVAQKRLTIRFEDSIADVLQGIESLATQVIRENLPALLTGTALHVAQDHSKATYAAIRKPSDGRVNWSFSAIQLHNFIRAQTHPYPGAFCLTDSGDVLRIWKAEVFAYPFWGAPGQVVMIEGAAAVVACGDGSAIQLISVQPTGKDEQYGAIVLKLGQRLQ